MRAEVFSVAKYDSANEDCCFIPRIASRPIVLCDGASESYDSARWARILAENAPLDEDFNSDWLHARIVQFESGIDADDLSWSKRLAYDRGSFSTFLSVRFRQGKCLVNAIGDTEAVAVNSEGIIDACPYHKPEQFLSRPSLFSTRPELNLPFNGETEPPFIAQLNLDSATHVLLLTDALAHWLLKKNDPMAIASLLDIGNEAEFQEFVEAERKRDLRFDDTTMIRIRLHEPLPMLYERGEQPGE